MLELFYQNKYTKIYFSIITRAIDRILNGYKENHHIIPKCLKGSNETGNLVFLTAKEHFICHLLLTKMVKTKKHRYQMASAVKRMSYQSHTHQRYTSRLYHIWKPMIGKAQSAAMMGKNNHFFLVKDIPQKL